MCGNKIADSSRNGVDSFPTYLHKGISRPPSQRISDNISKGFAPFFMPLIQTSASGSIVGSRNCLIIIDLTRQQDKTATKHNEKSNITFDNAFSYGIVVFAGKRKLFCDKVWLLRGSILQQQLLCNHISKSNPITTIHIGLDGCHS